jgi:DegV family protein with EDD domain
VIPVPVQFGSQTFLDGVDPVQRFYELVEDGVAPTTAAPGPGLFAEVYRRVRAEADAIVSIHVMGTKSAVCQSARIGAEMVPEGAVHVFDSGQVSLGLGLMVLGAARMAREGAEAAEIVAWLKRAVPRTEVFAAIRDLTMLRRSGRASLGKALVAGLLDIKPILRLYDGTVAVHGQVRSWSRAVERLAELVRGSAGTAAGRVRLAVVHANAPQDGAALKDTLQQHFPGAEILVAEAGPSLAAHGGPGMVGVCLMRDPDAP